MWHVLADTLNGFDAMANRIGLRREWFQDEASTPHHDVRQSGRALVIAAGAIEIDRRQTVAIIRRIRGDG